MASSRDELAAWLRLLLTPGVGRDLAQRLVAAQGSAHAVFAADPAALDADLGPLAARLTAVPSRFDERWSRTVAWLDADPNRRHVVPQDDPRFPPLLREAADAPLLLFCEGRIELLQRPAIAIVGSRSATAQGTDTARTFAQSFARQGLTVVSGLATGIDGAAHEGALEEEASTIAVVGTGLDQVYPARHRALADRIRQSGLLLSEFPLGTPPRSENFPMRNRIIAGLALGTVVVEAALRSGSLITARLAAECGRDVFAVPGSVHADQSKGCHELIRQGATLVQSAQDVLEDLHGAWGACARPPQSAGGPTAARASRPVDWAAGNEGADSVSSGLVTQDPLLAALGYEPATLDQLVDRTGLPPALLGARLLELELDQQVARLPGGLFQRRVQA